jgi:hypothetical protein
MRRERHTKEDFLTGVQERVKTHVWGLDEINYLHENHSKYHLNYEDIGNLLNDVFIHTYQLALEDGVMNQLEVDQIAQIQKLAMAPIPQNKMQRDALKHQILFLRNKIDFAHVLQEQEQLKEKLNHELTPEPEFKPEIESVKEKINRVYYKTPRPKLTPYTYYSYSS